MEVAEHGIRTPAANHFDDVGVDPSAQKSHGSTGTECSGVDVGGVKAKVGGGSSDPDGGSDKAGSDVGFPTHGVDTIERREWVSTVRA